MVPILIMLSSHRLLINAAKQWKATSLTKDTLGRVKHSKRSRWHTRGTRGSWQERHQPLQFPNMMIIGSSGRCHLCFHQKSVSATSRVKCSIDNRAPHHRATTSNSPHHRRGLFRSTRQTTRQTGHSVTAGAQGP